MRTSANFKTQTGSGIHQDLIYDIGIHNGDDTAYYLSRGYRVVAVDANPLMMDAARQKFAEAVASGRLTLLNVGILDRAGQLRFYVNENDSKLSSFDHKLAGCHGDPCREIEVECLPLPELFARHGVPYFLKVDIEGADKLCAQSLRGSAPLPPFVSFEFMAADAETILATLRDLGYRRFKMIYGACFTQSEPIFRQEFGMRLLRKLYRRLPPFRAGLDHLPDRLRPAKEEFQVFRARHPYAFPPGSSGPFAEETHGPWRNADYILAALDRVKRRAASDPQANLWYDIHASF